MTQHTSTPRVALVHDYLTQRGGAERVVLEMVKTFPDAPLYTSLYEPDATFPAFADVAVHPSALNRVAMFRRDHRRALALLAPTFSGMKIADADVVVASSSGWAHGVRTDAPKVVYCHNPARWLYQRDQYLVDAGIIQRAATNVVSLPLTRWDRRAARKADLYLCQSSAVRDRIRTAYGIDAEVLPPPGGIDPTGVITSPTVAPPEPGFVLCVSRLLAYKNVDAIVQAFAAMPHVRLVVVGDGPERGALVKLAGPNVRFVGKIDDATLRWYYSRCAAVVAASYEDYGLTPLEGLAFGRPSVVLRWGGFLDTVDEGTTGLFFDQPTPQLIAAAVQTTVNSRWDEGALLHHLGQFGAERFSRRLREVVAEVA